MSEFRKLLLAFAAVTLLTGIASAGIQPVLSVTAQPHSVRVEALAPENIVSNLFPAESVPCGAGLQTAPEWLNNFGAPAAMPAPNIAANPDSGNVVASGNAPIIANTGQTTLSAVTAQAASTIAGTPATTLNSNLNGTETINTHFVAVDSGQMSDDPTVSNAFNTANAAAQPGHVVVATHPAAPAVARTAPKNAGVKAS